MSERPLLIGRLAKLAGVKSDTVRFYERNGLLSKPSRTASAYRVYDEAALKQFSAVMKLEPFRRGMRQLAPKVWITALRKVQNPNRAGLDIVSHDLNFGTLKVNPVFYLSDEQMEAYLEEHHLPNEWDYFDPAKADEKRECGLHVDWGRTALAGEMATC